MGVLESVLNYKARKEAEQAQAANAIHQAVAAFIQGRQQQVENQQKNTLLGIQAAQAGYTITPDGQLSLDPNSRAYQKDLLATKQAESTIGLNKMKEAALQQKMENPSLSPSRENLKTKQTSEIYDVFNKNAVMKEQTEKIMAGLEQIPKGLAGREATKFMQNLSPDSPILGTWQSMKDLLTEIQLDKVSRTKGAVSDAEMELFGKAVGNDDLASAPRIATTIAKYRAGLEAKENAIADSFKRSWKEDPREWDEIKPFIAKKESSGAETFVVNGESYVIPKDKVESFKKAKGLK